MTDVNQFHDSFSDVPPPAKKLPDMLNVLTILTFIGCAIGLVMSFWNYFTICNKLKEMGNLGEDNPMAEYMNSMAPMLQKQCDAKMSILLIGLVCLLLCFAGALQMRKLKKPGFYIYALGEIAAPIAMAAIIGFGSGLMAIGSVFGFVISIVFIILYATQLKHLK
jgi:hypothetical protein